MALSVLALTGPASASDEETRKICAAAEERYQDMAVDLPSDDGVTIVLMYKYTFCPKTLEVPQGTTLRWINVDKRTSHSVWFKEDGGEESERLFPEEFVDMTMSEPGTYNYICGPHGDQEDMRAQVTVTAQ
ncbi:MAG: plastocyanin/azurin family copper-binding protein [Pseudomonadota bacterium]